jgi:hypothetical protein
LAKPEVIAATDLAGDHLTDVYVQTQMLMCLKVAQLYEKEEMAGVWLDYGRFYGERVTRLLDRTYEDRDYAAGLLRAFGEDSSTLFAHLNDRLKLIHSVFWSGSQYFYESLESWEPRETHA